jgi:pyrroline-5-carboxylate reductase
MHISLIGCGNMGEAILAGLHQKHMFHIVEARPERRQVLKTKYRCTFVDIVHAVDSAEIIILAVKPQDLSAVLEELSTQPLKAKLVISIAAGVTTSFIEKSLKQSARVVRVMPNLPAVIKEGVTGITKGAKAGSEDIKKAVDLFSAVGETVVVKEEMIDAVTAVSGSGPAYVFLFVECMMKAAMKLGFKEKEAKTLVYKTLTGSAHMLAASDDSAEELRAKVTSKGGTTQAATDVFMDRDIVIMFEKALKAAADRAKELSK